MYKIETVYKVLPLEAILPFHTPLKFLEMCRNCQNYGRLWSCPPYSFYPENKIKEFTQIDLYGTKIIFNQETLRMYNGDREAALDFGLQTLNKVRTEIDLQMLELEKQKAGSMALHSGGCNLCPACSRPQGEPCRMKDKMRYSLESLGFNVCDMVEAHLGIKILWIENELPPYLTLISGVLY